MPAVELRGLGRAYGERVALRDVSLRVERDQTLVVFGPNGAGKTTLLRVLATLLRPHVGDARVLGGELPAEGWAVRGRVGYVAHEPLLYRDLSPRENLRYLARLYRVEPPLAAVEDLGLGPRLDEPLRTLSRGMVQRVAIARATMHAPELLLLDEPWANLDPGARELAEPLIGRAARVARVVTSHDPEGGLAEADLAVGLRGGRALWLAPAGEVERRDVEALYR